MIAESMQYTKCTLYVSRCGESMVEDTCKNVGPLVDDGATMAISFNVGSAAGSTDG